MIVRYLYSACVVIETNDLRICCDPWFTQKIYHGAWYQYPVVENPIERIGPIDYVYVSHIHRDHYDPPFLQELLRANPNCQVLIGTENQAFLRDKMLREGFMPRSLDRLSVGATELAIIPNFEDAEINIDSALVVKGDGHIVVAMNDCAYDSHQVAEIMKFCGRSPDFACLPYAGAGPYPQAYRFPTEVERITATAAKKERFLQLFEKYLVAFSPKMVLPYAGIYYLGGPLRKMNAVRGVPDAIEVRERFGDRVVVLAEGEGSVNLATGEVHGVRTKAYDTDVVNDALRDMDDPELPYEHDEQPAEAELLDLLAKAHRNAAARISDHPDRSLCIKCPDTRYMSLNTKSPGVVQVYDSPEQSGAREEIYLDSRLLKGLLTKRYHWHSAEAGSHFEFYRVPDSYDRRIYNLLNFFHI